MTHAAYRAELRTTVPPAAALAWMLDLTEHDYDDPRFAHAGLRRRRRIVARGPGEVTAEDSFLGRSARVAFRRAGEDAIEVRSEGHGLHVEGTIRFLPAGDGGTRIVYEGTLAARGGGGLLLALAGHAWQRALTRSEAIHVARMEEEWARAPW